MFVKRNSCNFLLIVVFFLVCESYLSGTSGEITNPNYPNNYDINKNCDWFITASDNQQIELTIKEMDVEKGPSCNYDYIRLQEGFDHAGSIIGTYCGKNPPEPIRSSGNKVRVTFHSDDQQTRKGFKISWRAVTKGTSEGMFDNLFYIFPGGAGVFEVMFIKF